MRKSYATSASSTHLQWCKRVLALCTARACECDQGKLFFYCISISATHCFFAGIRPAYEIGNKALVEARHILFDEIHSRAGVRFNGDPRIVLAHQVYAAEGKISDLSDFDTHLLERRRDMEHGGVPAYKFARALPVA